MKNAVKKSTDHRELCKTNEVDYIVLAPMIALVTSDHASPNLQFITSLPSRSLHSTPVTPSSLHGNPVSSARRFSGFACGNILYEDWLHLSVGILRSHTWEREKLQEGEGKKTWCCIELVLRRTPLSEHTPIFDRGKGGNRHAKACIGLQTKSRTRVAPRIQPADKLCNPRLFPLSHIIIKALESGCSGARARIWGRKSCRYLITLTETIVSICWKEGRASWNNVDNFLFG